MKINNFYCATVRNLKLFILMTKITVFITPKKNSKRKIITKYTLCSNKFHCLLIFKSIYFNQARFETLFEFSTA